MKDKIVLTVALDKEDGSMNIMVGDGLDMPEKAKPGDIAKIRLGGKMSLPIIVQSFLTVLAQMKKNIMENPALPEKDHAGMEQEIYDLINAAVGGFLDQAFPLVNARPSLTEEACVEYGLDPKTATAQELLDAENKFLDEHPDRARETADMQLSEIKEHTGAEGGPNRKVRRAAKNK